MDIIQENVAKLLGMAQGNRTKELSETEKEILILKSYMSSVSSEQAIFVIRNFFTEDKRTGIEFLRIIYIYSEHLPKLREAILEEFKEELIGVAEEILMTEKPLRIARSDISKINTALRDELNEAIQVPISHNCNLPHMIETFYSDSRIDALLEIPTVQEIMKNTFSFDDIILLDDTMIQYTLREIDISDLIVALKGTSEELRDKIFKNMSHRAADSLREDMEALGPVRVSDVEFSQQGILKVVQRLSDEGFIPFKYL